VLVNAAAAKNAWNDKDLKTYDEIGGQATREIMKFSANQTFMAGLANLIKWMEDPDNKVLSKNFAGFMLKGAALPSGVQQAAKVRDPELRRRSTVLEEFASGMPITREALPKKLNRFGEEIVLPTGLNALFRPTKESKDPTIKELGKLQESVGLKISLEPRDMAGIKLTPQEVNEFQTVAGKLTKKNLDRFMRDGVAIAVGEKNRRKVTKKFSQMNDLEKKQAIEKIQGKIRKEVRDSFNLKARVIMRAVGEADFIKKMQILNKLQSKGYINSTERRFLDNAKNLKEIKARLDSQAINLMDKLNLRGK
jgi:hypothetical protein